MKSFLLLAMAFALAAPAGAYDFEDYARDLAARCPAKHLEWVSPGDLADYLDSFAQGLASADWARLEKEADVDQACAEVEAGASCQNFAQIRAAKSLNLLPRLLDSLCGRPLVCQAQSDCSPR